MTELDEESRAILVSLGANRALRQFGRLPTGDIDKQILSSRRVTDRFGIPSKQVDEALDQGDQSGAVTAAIYLASLFRGI